MNTEKETSSNLNLLAKSSIIVLIGIISSKLLAYIFRIIIAREFDPEVYGLYILGFTIVIWVSSIAMLGLPEGLIRFISIYRGKNDDEKIKAVFKKSLRILLFTSILSGALLFFFSDIIASSIFHNDKLALYLKIFSISLPFGILTNVLLALLKAFEKIGWYSFIYNFIQNITRVLVLIFLIFIGLNGTSTAISFVISMLAMFIFSTYVIKISLNKYFKKSSIKDSRPIKDLFSYSWPLMFSGILSSFLFTIDNFLIGFLLGIEQVGFYNAATPIALLLVIAPGIFMELFFPLINKAYARKNYKLIKELSKQVTKWIFFINVPATVLIFLFPGAFINFFFGSSYLAAESALRILVIGVFIQAIADVPKSLISMTGKSRLLFFNILFVGILNLVLNFILIINFGIMGAAIATSLSYLALCLVLFVQVKIYTGIIPLRRKAISIFLSCFLAALPVILLKPLIVESYIWIVFLLILYILTSICLFFLTGSLDRKDKEVISLFLRKLGYITKYRASANI